MDYRGEQKWFMDAKEDSIHTIPFILTCASALECSLNDHLFYHFSQRYRDSSKYMLNNAFMAMTLRGKLNTIIPLLTKFEFDINRKHKVYKTLVELISIRNRITHNKSDFEETVVEQDKLNGLSMEDFRRISATEQDYSMNVRGDVGRFQEALETLHEEFLEHYDNDDFKGTDLIVALKEDKSMSITVMPDE
ncbi:hypothetical protein [Pseudoalteromonas sp. DY56-GL79]|uniref:hypothetical protein n=1 Tax=Pseudoalteromonas sp. DY56-GL79 TaxID=2967131 RepID=UPI00352AE6EE